MNKQEIINKMNNQISQHPQYQQFINNLIDSIKSWQKVDGCTTKEAYDHETATSTAGPLTKNYIAVQLGIY